LQVFKKSIPVSYSADGKAVWTSGLINANALNGKQANASHLQKVFSILK